MDLVDSHCHLADERLRDDASEIITRARLAGVRTIISIGAIDPIATDRLTVELAERNRDIYAVVGVHPHDASACSEARIAELRELAASPRVVAIGESGLDFHYMHSPQQAQEASLRRHLALAAELDKPIVIHCRDAEERLAAIVRETGMPPRGGVVHCFTGNAASARTFLALGFYISFSGILTFRNAVQVREAALLVPIERVMVETDAPYLAPEPYRGQRNEPAYVIRTLEVLARIRGVHTDVLAQAIAQNTRRLFGLSG
ncbi:MAG: TatD family hydrolase [Deltaproteobacteria bacterium]|nr:TatD family hydrolase [Deltaproteobacteria bacterium]